MDNTIAGLLLLLICVGIWLAIQYRRFNKTVESMQVADDCIRVLDEALGDLADPGMVVRHILWLENMTPLCQDPSNGPGQVVTESIDGVPCQICTPILHAYGNLMEREEEKATWEVLDKTFVIPRKQALESPESMEEMLQKMVSPWIAELKQDYIVNEMTTEVLYHDSRYLDGDYPVRVAFRVKRKR